MLTPLQHRIFTFIQQYIKHHEYSPSLTEVATGIGISPKSISLISRHIHTLVAAGKLKFIKQGYRNLQVVDVIDSFIPFKGKIGFSDTYPENKFSLDFSTLFQSDKHYLLKVHDHTLQADGIMKDDVLICQQVSEAEEGAIVVACLDHKDHLLGRLSYQIPDRVTLIPLASSAKPKAYLSHRVKIEALCVGVLRLYR